MLAVISLNASLSAVRNPGPHSVSGSASVKKAASQKSQAIQQYVSNWSFPGDFNKFFFLPRIATNLNGMSGHLKLFLENMFAEDVCCP